MNYGYSCRATEDDSATKTAFETFLDSTGQLQSSLEQEDEDVSVEDESDKLRKKLTALQYLMNYPSVMRKWSSTLK